MDIDQINSMNKDALELETKRVDYQLKRKELNKYPLIYSPLLLSIVTVLLSSLASFLISNGQLKQSEKNFNAGLIENIMDDDVFITKRKIEFLLAVGALEDNKTETQKALSELCKKSSNHYLQKGIQFSESGDDYSSILQLDIAIELDSSNHEFYHRRAISNFNLAKKLESKEYHLNAIKDYKKTNEIRPNYLYQLKIGEIYSILKEFEISNEFCEQAIKIKPKCYQCYDLQAKNYIAKGDLRKACEAYNNSQNINPTPLNKANIKETCGVDT